ncbi:serine/threonine-protein kinase Nek6-like [Chanos chanos]|uniref:non-specific serine/threonine protein kinase n=1 Tax=Chanos chanos TaxID=29144 RepID=A0A6J2VTL3_CHACN|nr:serine/threonine-protein kinase Nek6-like [Chanos chanos]
MAENITRQQIKDINSALAYSIAYESKDKGDIEQIALFCRYEEHIRAIQAEKDGLSAVDHPYIALLKESFEENDKTYIVTEYCEGGDLAKKIEEQNGHPFPEDKILDWFVQICLALKNIHEKNILHRDIKPHNIFLTGEGYISLGDFGSSRVLDISELYASKKTGSFFYMSPEIMEKRPYNNKSDLWSLAWVLHDLCMPEIFSSATKRLIKFAASLEGSPPSVSAHYSSDLESLIRELLSVNPEDRPSVDEILAKPFLSNIVRKNQRVPEKVESKLCESAESLIPLYNDHFEDLESLVRKWKELTDNLETFHRGATIGSLSGGVSGAVGGIMTIVGAALAPFTLGASLIVTGVGIGLAAVGGVTGAASNITNVAKQKTLRSSIEDIQKEIREKSEPIVKCLGELKKYLKKVQRFGTFAQTQAKEIPIFDNVLVGARAGRNVAWMGHLAELINIANIAGEAVRAVRVATIVTGAIFLLLDVIFIYRDAREIHEMNNKKDARDDEIKSNILKAINEMRKAQEEYNTFLKRFKEAKEDLEKYLLCQ